MRLSSNQGSFDPPTLRLHILGYIILVTREHTRPGKQNLDIDLLKNSSHLSLRFSENIFSPFLFQLILSSDKTKY